MVLQQMGAIVTGDTVIFSSFFWWGRGGAGVVLVYTFENGPDTWLN